MTPVRSDILSILISGGAPDRRRRSPGFGEMSNIFIQIIIILITGLVHSIVIIKNYHRNLISDIMTHVAMKATGVKGRSYENV